MPLKVIPDVEERPALKVAGLFAGVGGIELGLSAAGHEATLLCEIDPTASRVLSERFPDAGLVADVTTLEDVGPVDLVTAGFPCQDLSRGWHDSRHGRLEVEHGGSRLPFVAAKEGFLGSCFENVPFMLQLGKGEALEVIVRALEELGYRWAYRVIDSRAFGLPQRRERVYLLAALDDDPRTVLFAGNDAPEAIDAAGRACGFYWTEGTRGLGWAVDAIPTLKGGSTIGIPSPPAIWLPDGRIVQPDIRDAERLQGFPVDWTKPAEHVGRASLRWRLVGNAVSVNAARWIGQRLRNRAGSLEIEGESLSSGRSWPRAAFNVADGRKRAEISAWPMRTARPPLEAFLQYEPKPLSAKATAGFYSRFTSSALRKPPGFIDALEAHLSEIRPLIAAE